MFFTSMVCSSLSQVLATSIVIGMRDTEAGEGAAVISCLLKPYNTKQ